MPLASENLHVLLRATSCWQAGRLWTTAMIWEEQIREQLGRLGLTPPPGAAWEDYVVTYSAARSVAPIGGLYGGRHDEDLLRRVMEEATRQPTMLVTNDEGLFEQARRHLFCLPSCGFTAENSTDMMLRLLDCGAVPESVIDACLAAEHRNLQQMLRNGMDSTKFEVKLRRLERASQRLILRRFDEDSPDAVDG